MRALVLLVMAIILNTGFVYVFIEGPTPLDVDVLEVPALSEELGPDASLPSSLSAVEVKGEGGGVGGIGPLEFPPYFIIRFTSKI